MSSRAQPPPAAPLDFPPPKISHGRRTAGHVQVPDPTTEDAGPLEMSWKIVSAGALVDAKPTKLRRTSTIAGNILVTNDSDGSTPRKAFWLQRKLTEETHTRKYVRIGFPLQPVSLDGEEIQGAWTVTKAEEGSLYPFEMVAIKVEEHESVFPEEEELAVTGDKKEGDDVSEKSNIVGPARNARNEIAALQMIQAVDPDGKGNVLRAECVVSDELSVYIVMPYCKEGTLLDKVAASRKNGRLEEAEARMYFVNILNGLETLQKVKICHRNLSLETMLIRGDECHIGSLGFSLRIPTSENGNVMHLIEPQLACGKWPEYVAPEIFKNQAFDGFLVDLWAAGVILFKMLFGSDMLFAAPMPEDPKFQDICVRGNLKSAVDKFHALIPDEKPISEEAIDLVQSMLRAEPLDRLTLAQIKDHPWIKACGPVGVSDEAAN